LLVEQDRGSPPRDGPRRGEDLRILVEAMLTVESAEEVVAKNDTEFSRLLSIPKARVASALAAGEQRGVFIRRALPMDSRTGETEILWQLSPVFMELQGKFARFAEASSRLSREVAETASIRPPKDPRRNADFNLRIAKTIFGKWSVDILALIYSKRAAGFQEIHRALGRISDRVLSLKLGQMEELGLLHREVLGTKPPRVQYSLTTRGLRTAMLGEPVFLYLRFTEGLLATDDAEDSGRASVP
jgi:DNA-binding HxlR family transcriptional regulator